MSPQTETYLKFDISGVLESVISAKLRVYVTNGSKNAPKVKIVDNNWSESSVIYATKPLEISSSYADQEVVKAGMYVDYDVTSLFQTNGIIGEILSFGFFPDSSDGFDFYSKESSNPPQLIVEFSN